METKISQYQTKIYNYAQRLRDVRVVGLVLFAVVVLLMSWSGVKAIDANYDLQKQIAGLQQQNELGKLGNTNMKLSNQYYQSEQYLEIMARQNFGLAAPGETVLVVPKGVALAHTQAMPDTEAAQKVQTESKQPAYQRHFQAWMNFLFHRQNR
jgi:cell division protein FtsB